MGDGGVLTDSLLTQLSALEIIFHQTDQQLSKFTPILFPALLPIYHQSSSDLQHRCLSLLTAGLESLSWADGVDPELVGEALMCWGEWQPLLIRNLEAPETMGDLRSALKVMNVFYRDYQTFSKEFLTETVKPVWILMYSLLPHFYQQVLFAPLPPFSDSTSSDEASPETYPGMHGIAVLLLELLSSLTLRPSVRQAISQELTPIIRTLSNYLLLSKAQTIEADPDPAQFLIDDESEIGIRSARGCALKLISELLEVFREEAVKSVLTVAEMMCREPFTRSGKVRDRVATNQPEIVDFVGRINVKIDEVVSTQMVAYAWKSREAGMLLVGKSANDVLALNIHSVKHGELGVSLDPIFESVLPALLSPITPKGSKRSKELLQGRTLWTVARVSDILILESQVYTQVLDLCVASTGEAFKVPIKFTACFAVSKFGKHLGQGFLERLSAMLRNLFKLATVTVDDTLHLVLETIRDLSSLSEETTDEIAKEFSSKILALFTHYHSDSVIGPDLISILRLWADIPIATASLSCQFLPYIGNLLRGESLNTNRATDSPLPTALDLLQILLLKLKAGSVESGLVLDLLPALLNVLNVSVDIPVLLHGTNCLRCFIATFHEEILERGGGDHILETVARLLSPSINETAAPHLGYCLLQVFDKISPKVDEDLVLSCITKLYKSKMPSIVQGLVLVCARLIHMNPSALISFLLGMTVERRVGLKVLLDKWLIHQPLMRGKYTKNATVSALARLFTLKDKRLEALLVIGFNPSHTNLSAEVPAPLKILSTLIRCLDNEAAPRKAKPSATVGLNEEFNTVVEAGGLGVGGHIDFEDSGERVDTIEDDSEKAEEEKEASGDDAMAGLKKQLLSEVQEDFESTFQLQEKKKGLGDYETGSECLMSDMLDFDYDDGDELGEDFYEDDLYSMGDWYGSLNLQNFLLEFFGRLIENDKDYLKSCFRHMLNEDVALFKKHFTLV